MPVKENLLLHRQEDVAQAAMGDGDAFGRSGGAGGVDDVGEVVRPHGAGGGALGMRRNRRRRAIKLQPPHAGRPHPIAQPRLREQQRRPGIRQHEAQALGWIAGVERQIGATGLEDAEQTNHQLQRALQAHPHHALRSHPDRISSRPIATSGAATAASSRRTSRPARTSTLPRSNRSLAYSITPLIPPALPSAVRRSARLTDKSNFALASATGSTLALTPASSSSTAALFCNANITWNSGWCANERAGLSASTSRSNGSS